MNKPFIEGIPLYQIGDTYQYLGVEAGENEIVFTLSMPSGYTGFVKKIWVTQIRLCYSHLIIDDGKPFNLVTSPHQFKPPIIVERKIKVISYNDSGRNQLFDAYILGFCYDFAHTLKKFKEMKIEDSSKANKRIYQTV